MSMTTRKTVFCCFAFTDIGEGFQTVVVVSEEKWQVKQIGLLRKNFSGFQ
jgi:hypothetical protein